MAMQEEHQYRWEPLNEPPEGWRKCDYRDIDDDGMLHVLWTDAPKDENPHLHSVFWQQFRRITQRRFVTEWEDIG